MNQTPLPPPIKPTFTAPKVLAVIALFFCSIFIFLFLLGAIFSDGKSTTEPVTEEVKEVEKRDYVSEAIYASQEYVRQNIKSPASAEFPFKDEFQIAKMNDSLYIVKGYVDAQNGFGALIRANYSCSIVFTKDGQVKGKGLVIR